ncbi:MAG TPA: hypothetical protein VFR81_00310 [Longimicrobium sp.]|nr:hypothetical protein [Longimicrobium sp.]
MVVTAASVGRVARGCPLIVMMPESAPKQPAQAGFSLLLPRLQPPGAHLR